MEKGLFVLIFYPCREVSEPPTGDQKTGPLKCSRGEHNLSTVDCLCVLTNTRPLFVQLLINVCKLKRIFFLLSFYFFSTQVYWN